MYDLIESVRLYRTGLVHAKYVRQETLVFALNTLLGHARKSNHKSYHHVAILTKGGAVVSVGWNHGECHAEEKATRRCWKDHRPGLVLWSFRLTKSGKLAMALPCEKCQKMLVANGILKVHYSDRKGQIQTIKLKKKD